MARILTFGDGTTLIEKFRSSEGCGLELTEGHNPHPIGSYGARTPRVATFEPHAVVLMFKNLESLDVLIEELRGLAQYMPRTSPTTEQE